MLQLTEHQKAVVREGMLLWRQRCAQYVERHGDAGTCVLGAGIIPREVVNDPKRWDGGWVDWDDYLIHVNDVTSAQGSLVWEDSVDEVVNWFKSNGMDVYYHPGRMD